MSFSVSEYARKRKSNNINNGDINGKGGFSVQEYVKQRSLPKVGEYLTTSINDWLKKNEAFYSSYNDRIGKYQDIDPLDWAYEADSADWLNSVTSTKGELDAGAEEILSIIKDYGQYLDIGFVRSVKSAIDGNRGQYSNILSHATEMNNYWSEFETEDAYKEYVAGQKDYKAKLNYDLEAGKAEIEALEARLAESGSDFERWVSKGLQPFVNDLRSSGATFIPSTLAENIQGLEAEISEKKAYYNLAERAQNAAKLASVADPDSENYDPAFAEKSQYKSTVVDNRTWWDDLVNNPSHMRIEYDDAKYEWINGNKDVIADVKDKDRVYSSDNKYDDGKTSFENAGYEYMTDDEIAIYNYYYNTEGKAKAEEYLDSIAEDLNTLQARVMAGEVEGNLVAQYIFAVEAGLDQFSSGVKSIFTDEYVPTSATQIASGIIREDLADTGATLPDWLGGDSIGQVGYDIINTGANMLPSILASAVVEAALPTVGEGIGVFIGTQTAKTAAKLTGAAVLGASAGGNGKAEMLRLGYSLEQANSYGLMVGAAEAGMEYALGHIPGLSSGDGIFSSLGAKAATKIDNAISRVAIKLGNKGTSILRAAANGGIKIVGGMLDEGLEEGLQTIIEPWLKEAATGVDWDDPSIDEVLYSSLLGALTSVALGGIGDVASEVNTYKAGRTIQKVNGGVSKLQEIATNKNYFSADTVAYKIASEVNAQTDAYTIGKLLSEVGGTISEQNFTDIVNGLTERGVRKSDAVKIAREYQKDLNNEMMLPDEIIKDLYKNLSPLADVLRKNIIGANTTVYQRTRAYSDLMNLADEVANVKKDKSSKTEATPAETTAPSANIFEQGDIIADAERIASEVASGKRTSASERVVKNIADSANSAAEAKLGVEGRYTSSETGRNRLASNRKRVNIVGVDSIEDGVMNLKLDDGSVVSAEDIDFSSSNEALVYEAVTNMGVSANTAWEIIKGYDPKSGQSGTIYAMGALEAYTYGHNGVKVDGMSKDGFASLLSPVQKNTANRLGDIDARAKVEAQQKTIDKAVKSVRDEAKSKHKAIPLRKGQTVFEGDRARLTNLQKSQLDVLERVAEGLGVTFHIFESKVDAEGKRYYKMPNGKTTSANGWYDPKTGEIWIDLYAGNDGQGTMIFTAAHELTHFIRQWSPAKFKVFADFLFEQYGKKGQDVNQLIREQIQKAANNGRSISWDEAYEEVIADSCETFLRDSKASEKIAALREKDVSLANKIKTILGQMLAKMRKLMADLGLAPETKEGKMVAEMTDSLEKLYNLWTDALADAGKAYSTLADIDFDTESVAPMLSERTWTASEYVTEREKTAKEISKALGVDIKIAYKYIDDINSVARLIADDRARLDYEPNLDEHATVLKPNSDYKYSVDMSTLCAKRLLFTGTFDAIQRALPNTVFDSEDIVALREMMQKRGYEVACGICYVESTRREIGRITQDFINSYKESQKTGKPITRTNSEGKVVDLKKTNDEKKATADKSTDKFFAEKDYTPTLADLNTTDIDLVKRDHPLVYEAYLNFMNARGQAKPKLLETRAEYKGEILKHFKYKSAVTSRNNAGGLRLQSFSDFEVPHLIDMMQIVMDMSRVGLKSQAYTKVPAFAEVFGDTGVKINLSLIAKGDGLDANGNLIFDDVEGINHNEAFKLRDKYSKNVGTILVGKTDAHIIAAMADPRIDYIIPFHKSSWKESLYDALGLTGYADYTDTQHEKPIDKSRKISDYDPSEYWDFSKTGDENAQIYLAKCREDGRIPKFPQFQGYPGYWKLLIDFKMYDNDGVGSPQEVVRPTFNTEASERILSEYKGGHKSFPVAKDVVEDFVKEHQDKGIRYSTRETLAEASSKLASISDEDYLKDKEANPFVFVMEHTPKIVLDSMEGSNDRKILIRRDALYLAIRENGIQPGHYHGLGDKVLSELPKYLEEPDAILSTDDNESRRLVLSHIPVKNGQAIISIEFESIKDFDGSKEYFNVVITVFDLHENYLKRLFKKNGAEIKYKKEDLAQSNPQLYEWLRIINAKSPKDSIAQVPDSVNRDTEKNSLRNVEPIETADYVKMYRHFGSTKNYDVAGYILGNGIMLDFSGKHWGDDFSTFRQVDHRDIQETLGNRGSNNGVNAMVDMIGNGNIRLMPEVGGINLAVKPNATQMSQLRGYINHFRGEVTIDIDEVGGDTIHSFSYTRGTSSAKVLADIKAYFDEGVVPKQKGEGDTDIRQFLYSDRVVDKKTVNFLENQEHVTVYRAMQVIDGKLYPPMNAYTYDENGKKVLMPHSEIGAWEQSVERPDLIDPKTGKFKLDKGKVDGGKRGTAVPAAYNPYIHTSLSMLNDQFTSAYQRSNLVVVKGVVPKSELTSGYHAQYAKDSVGETEWHSGVVSTQLPKSRKVILSRWFKPVEIISNDDVAESIKEMLTGTDIEIPYNVVSPGLRRSLEKIGVPIGEGRGIKGLPKKDDVKYSDRSPSSVSTRSLLANALETTAQNDIERTKLEQYKSKIELIEAEYAKLAEIKKQANDIRFTKGRTSAETKQMKALEFEANQIANRINVYDRQLLNLESTTALKNVLQREKKLAYDKAKKEGKEALAKYREKAAKTQRELMNRHTESRQKAVDSRNRTEMRGKIKKVVGDLKTLLLGETKDKHVPIGLQKAVAEALDIINMDTVGADERVAKYNDLIAKSSDPDIIAELTKSRDRIALQGENLADKLNALKSAYAEIKNSDDPLIKGSHDESIENLIHNTAITVGETSLRDMSYEQLEAVYDMYKAILTKVRNANKMFKEGKQETITANSEWTKREISAAGGHRNRVLKATKFLKKFGWNMLKPIYAMKLIGSDTLTGLYENVRKGEDVWAVDVNEAKDFFKETAKKYEYNTWDFKKPYKFTDSAGHSFSLTLEQIMSLYAYSKRSQADKHLEIGGFIFDDSIEVTEKNKLGIPMKYEVNDANPYRLKKEDLGKIIDLIKTDMPNVKGFVDEMQAYLSDVMGAKGNEVSLAMYDIKLYKEQNYFPLKSAKYFREFDPEKNGTPKIKNSGFSKKTVPQAGNPIILSNFMDVWANHVNDMSMYHAFVLPLEDFMRVYNYSSTAGGYDSVQQYIKNAYGSQANTYIETLMNDLNGGARTDPATDLIGKGMSLFKKTAVFASASVVIQQPSAIARALAYIDPKYFVDKPVPTKHSETWAEVKKYAPVAIIKEMGYFDTNMGRSTMDFITSQEYEGVKEKFKAVFTDGNYRDEILSKAPALADELAWCAIWKAVKREVADSTNLQVGSEEFLKLAGKRFTEVVTKTQVYDSVLSRSALMRSKDTGAKMVTAFMAEPTTSLNMTVDALVEGKRGNKKFAGRAVGAVVASIILNSILVSFVTAARDDDEDETYIEKYLESLTAEIIDGFNPLTYIPLVKDIWSIAQGYDVERSDMSIWSDFFQSIENLFSNKKSGFEKVEGVVGAVSSFFGLPLKNIMRDARAMYNLTETLLSGTPTTWAGVGDAVGGAIKSSIPLYNRIEKWVGADESKSDNLYDAIISGDQNQIDRVKSQYKDDKAIESAIRQALRENDSRIKEAAKAHSSGDIRGYSKYIDAIVAEGHFDKETVEGAIRAEQSAFNTKINKAAEAKNNGDDAEYKKIVRELRDSYRGIYSQDEIVNLVKKAQEELLETDDDEVEEATSIYKASDVNSAFESGDNEMALEVIDDLINTKVANGMTEKEAKSSIRSSMTSYWKPLYKAAYKSGNTAEKERIERILKASGLYGNASEVIKTCRGWRTERD